VCKGKDKKKTCAGTQIGRCGRNRGGVRGVRACGWFKETGTACVRVQVKMGKGRQQDTVIMNMNSRFCHGCSFPVQPQVHAPTNYRLNSDGNESVGERGGREGTGERGGGLILMTENLRL
jgi:hypothetical protein